MRTGIRTKITRSNPRPRCGMSLDFTGTLCSKPARVKWEWRGGWMFVCRRHDKEIRRMEAAKAGEDDDG